MSEPGTPIITNRPDGRAWLDRRCQDEWPEPGSVALIAHGFVVRHFQGPLLADVATLTESQRVTTGRHGLDLDPLVSFS